MAVFVPSRMSPTSRSRSGPGIMNSAFGRVANSPGPASSRGSCGDWPSGAGAFVWSRVWSSDVVRSLLMKHHSSHLACAPGLYVCGVTIRTHTYSLLVGHLRLYVRGATNRTRTYSPFEVLFRLYVRDRIVEPRTYSPKLPRASDVKTGGGFMIESSEDCGDCASN